MLSRHLKSAYYVLFYYPMRINALRHRIFGGAATSAAGPELSRPAAPIKPLGSVRNRVCCGWPTTGGSNSRCRSPNDAQLEPTVPLFYAAAHEQRSPSPRGGAGCDRGVCTRAYRYGCRADREPIPRGACHSDPRECALASANTDARSGANQKGRLGKWDKPAHCEEGTEVSRVHRCECNVLYLLYSHTTSPAYRTVAFRTAAMADCPDALASL